MEDGTTIEQQMFTMATEKKVPLYGVLELLPLCNLNCDMCYVRMSREEMEEVGRLRTMEEYPALSDYIAYTTVGHEIDPMSYVKGMEMNGATYTYADDGEALAGTREAISVKSEVDYSKAGVYPVEYSYTAEGAPTAVTKLFVVVQDQEVTQDGK